jgi:hypothetical protein
LTNDSFALNVYFSKKSSNKKAPSAGAKYFIGKSFRVLHHLQPV